MNQPASTPTQQPAPRTAVILALLTVYLVWGSTYLGIKIAVESIPPLFMSGWRFIIAGLGLLLFLRASGAAWPTRREWINSAKVGLLLMVGGNGGVTLAQYLGISSGIAATLVALMPVWLALWETLWGTRPSRLEWSGMALGFLGVLLLFSKSGFRSSPLAVATILLAPVCWSLGSSLSRRLALPKGFMASAAEMLTGGVALLALSFVLGERFEHAPSPRSGYAFFYLTIFGSLLGYSAYMYLLANVRPTLASSYTYVNPAIAVLLGVWLANESIGWPGLGALLAILLGVGLIGVSRGQETN